MTDKEIAEIFRKLSRKENLSKKELEPGVNYFAPPAFPEDVEEFFNDCFAWFYKKMKLFAEASDVEVIGRVRSRLRAYLGYRWAKQSPTKQRCPVCKGRGQDKQRKNVCQICGGTGKIRKPNQVSHPEQFPPI